MVAALGVLFFLNEQPSSGSLGKVLDATVPPGVVPGRDPKGTPPRGFPWSSFFLPWGEEGEETFKHSHPCGGRGDYP